MPDDQAVASVKPKMSSRRKRWLIRFSLLFLVLGFIYFIYWVAYARFFEVTDDAYVNGNMIRVMSQISGQVTEILADETDLVTKGEPIIILDKADASIKLKNSEEKLAITIRQVYQLYKNLDQLQARVQEQQDALEKAQEDYKRRQGLIVNKTISDEDLHHAKIAVETATAALASAKDQLSSAKAFVGNTTLYNHPQVQQAIVDLRNAFLNWIRTTIMSPETGYIAKRPVQIGEEVTPGTILMVIVPLKQIWIDANYKESQLEYIRIGQPVTVVSDAYGSDVTYQGHVIGLSPGTGSIFDLLPPQNATGNWIKIVQRLPVRIGIDAEQLRKFPLRMGLSVTVSIKTSDRKGQILSQAPQKEILYQTYDQSAALKQANALVDKILKDNAPDISAAE